MNITQTEARLAKSAYDWLRISPFPTLITLFFVASWDAGESICSLFLSNDACWYTYGDYFDFCLGVLVSGLWHLTLLKYANNTESGFVRGHGQNALTLAGVRTGVAFLGVALAGFLQDFGSVLIVLTIFILFVLWVSGLSAGAKLGDQIKDILKAPASQPRAEADGSNAVHNLDETTLGKILEDLQSDDDVAVLAALDKLASSAPLPESDVKKAVLKEIELLAAGDDNKDVRIDAQGALNHLREESPAVRTAQIAGVIPGDDKRNPKEVLDEIFQNLKTGDETLILRSLASLKSLSYSSEAIRLQLEALALKSGNTEIRDEALAVLDSPANRAVQKQLTSNQLDRGLRYVLLHEINGWIKNNLIEKQNAEVIRRRYDFDFERAPQPKPTAAAVQPAAAAPQAAAASVNEQAAAPPQNQPSAPPEPRPSLLQTLTSEASIKIYLYLGAFFVIAAAAILGAVVPELRLPILIIGTFIFGGLAIVIKKRLPQPSFALFIVFSFLLPITANSIEETLRQAFNFTSDFTDAYWALVFILMAIVWVGSTWLYESRLFPLTAFGSLILASFRLGDLFEADSAYYALLMGLTALAGLAGTWLLKKWRDAQFALPLFIAAHILQMINLAVSLGIFGIDTFEPSSQNLLNLVILAAWVLGTVFYFASEGLYPFFAFPWLAAATSIPMPWLAATAFDLESLGSAILLFIWGAILAVVSEPALRLEKIKKYGLPVLLASMPSLALGILTGFVHETWLGLVIALATAVLFSILHLLQSRWWLWSLALLNTAIAYFAFFQLEFIQPFDIFLGYQLAGAVILFLLPDLLLTKDWALNLAWRLPLRVGGAIFLFIASFALFPQENSASIAVSYAILAVFCIAYALAYRNHYLAYLPAAYLPLAVIYALDAFNIDAWLPALAALAALYYLAGAALRSKAAWGVMLRNSGMALGALLSFAALSLTKESGGWYALVMGLLFIAETYLRRSGWFEIGAPVLFTAGIYLILNDLKVEQATYHLLAYSLVWLLADLLAHLTFRNPRPLSIVVRLVGGVLAAANYALLFAETDAWNPVIGFGLYTLLFLTISLIYRQPVLFYAFSLTLPLFTAFLFRAFNVTQWIHPVIVVAGLYYAAGYLLRRRETAKGWEAPLLNSGLGLGVIVSFGALALGGVDASIPVAVAATLWAVEAFAKRNAWLAFPANGLYLLAYFIILFELNVDEPQFFSVGTAMFGLIQHYLLVRAQSKTGAFTMGMFSQFVLLGTTYIQMVDRGSLIYFFLLFAESLVVLVYGIVIRSRSLTFFPIGFVALGVVTVVYSALKDIGTIFVIGCTGIVLLTLGVVAVLLRERIAKLGERLSDWKA